MKRILNKRLKGGFTIEAAVIVPISMLIIASVMIVVFILHDRVMLRTVSLSEVMEHTEGFKEDAQTVSEGIEDMLKKRLIMAKEAAVTEEIKEGGVNIYTEANITIPLWSIREMTGDIGSVASQINISNLNSREVLIRYKTICDGLDMIAGEEDSPGSEQGEES